jgi:hypothetical protein
MFCKADRLPEASFECALGTQLLRYLGICVTALPDLCSACGCPPAHLQLASQAQAVSCGRLAYSLQGYWSAAAAAAAVHHTSGKLPQLVLPQQMMLQQMQQLQDSVCSAAYGCAQLGPRYLKLGQALAL